MIFFYLFTYYIMGLMEN